MAFLRFGVRPGYQPGGGAENEHSPRAQLRGQKEEGSRRAKRSELSAASSGHDTTVVKKMFAPFL